MKFSLVIPTKDRQEILNKTLTHLQRAHNISDVQVIIINDSDKELNLSSYSFSYEVHRNPGSGVASGRNYGALQAKNDWLIFMDDDMIVKEGVFKKVSQFCVRENERACLNINWIYPEYISRKYDHLPLLRYLHKYGFDSLKGWKHTDVWSDEKLNIANLITSQFLVIHKRLFFELGGYDESFPFAGFEDHDLSKRLQKAGIPVFIDPEVLAYHNEEDRLNLLNWLERRKRGAVTRRIGVEKGHEDLKLDYSLYKSLIYRLMFLNKDVLLFLLNNWPKTKRFDSFYFLLVNLLFGTYSYVGYTKAKQFNTRTS